MQITRDLARFLVDTRSADIPDDARREATRTLVNYMGCALGGAHHEAVTRALEALKPFAGAPQASLFGRSERIDAPHAALLNGMSAHVLDFDDTHLRTLLHPGVPVASTLLAVAELEPFDGRAFLDAFVLGVEVACRIANAICGTHNVSSYITGTAGVFGAAAAAGRVLGLDERRMTYALGIAATQAAGLREMAGTMCKSFVHGRAAQNGLLSAFMARHGFTSAEHAIEGPRGFVNVIAPGSSFEEIAVRPHDPRGLTPASSGADPGLDHRWQILLNTYKPYACGIVCHPAIDGCLRLRDPFVLSVAAAKSKDERPRVHLRVHPLALKLTGIKDPAGGLESKWSLYHSAAVALIDGAAGERQYTDERVHDPAVAVLRASVTAEADAALRDDEAHVTVTLADGRVLETHVEHATGSADNPLSDAGLEAKFRALAEGVLPEARITQLIAQCRGVGELSDVGALARLASATEEA